jgi:hypothetical protein
MQKIIPGLVGLNVVLAGCLAVTLVLQTSRKKNAGSAGSSPSQTYTGVKEGSQPSLAPNNSSLARKGTWSALASPDLKKYAANLRRVGCPEDTIQEIMVAEVNRLYSARERGLKVRPDDVAPWEAGGQRDRRGAESKLRQILAEKRNLLKELTGVDTGISMPSRLAGRDVDTFEAAFGALPESTRDQVRAIQENYWAQSDDIKQRTVGYLEPEDREEFQRIKTERREELAKILTPQELQDYEMQTSATAPALRSRFEGFDVTDQEFRKVFDFMQPLDEQYSLSRRNPDPVNQEFTTARDQAEKDLQTQIHQVLGDERYAEYERTRDPVYRNLRQIGSEEGVPQESILQAYQAQQQMQQEASRLLQDPNLTQEQRAQGLQDLRTLAEQKLQQLFGDKANQILQRLPGIPMAGQYGLRVNGVDVNLKSGANP